MLVLSHEGEVNAGSNEQPGKCSPQNGSNRGETSIDERVDTGLEFHKN